MVSLWSAEKRFLSEMYREVRSSAKAENLPTPISSMMTTQTKAAPMVASVAQIEKRVRNIMHFHQEKKDPKAVSAWEMCNYKPITVPPDTSISDVAKLMVSNGVHHILVTENRHTVGIISALDFVRRYIQGPV